MLLTDAAENFLLGDSYSFITEKMCFNIPDHFCPFHCWSIWLFRRRRLVCVIARQWREHRDVGRADGEVRDQLYPPLTMRTDDKHNDSVCCRMAQCPREPNTSGPVSGYRNCIVPSGTYVWKEPGLINPLLSQKCQFFGLKLSCSYILIIMDMFYVQLAKSHKKYHGPAGDRTRGLSHAKRTRYHCATSPYCSKVKLMSVNFNPTTKKSTTII